MDYCTTGRLTDLSPLSFNMPNNANKGPTMTILKQIFFSKELALMAPISTDKN